MKQANRIASRITTLFLLSAVSSTYAADEKPKSVSGIYPHLAMFNNEGECGTGAVVPWANRLWVVTYAPHQPTGSSDKLYEITPDLQQIIRPESIGGTPANRMIHRESNQLFIGPYAVDGQGTVRAIPYSKMFGRPTGTARHLFDPANKVYYATMEEGIYEVDVKTLEVKELWADEAKKEGRKSGLPGYHGKGFYMSQNRVVYANNGDHAPQALSNPSVPSGALAQWDGKANAWEVVRRNQFTEVTGPGGIYGNENPANDPIWSVGWDHRSLILQVLDKGTWHSYRLPKGSHSYDGAHGWNTEWPRIRDIGENDLLMTMHGTFWRFPKTFSASNSAGIAPRSNYLKVIGDFARWNDKVVFGCDDTAKNEFLNKRAAKGNIAGPGRSQSNLWFVEPTQIDNLGPAIGRGGVWINDEVEANAPSDAFLFSGYDFRALHLSHDNAQPIVFTVEVDKSGNGNWMKLRDVLVPGSGYAWTAFLDNEKGAWVRLRANRDCAKVSATFHYRNEDKRGSQSAALFEGVAKPGQQNINGGLIHARGADFKTLRFVASDAKGELGAYDLDAGLKLRRADDPQGLEWTRKAVAIPNNVLQYDAASILYIDGKKHWRLPKGDTAFDAPGALGDERADREVATERDLFNAGGTFYELPAENAGGFAKIRPVTTHNRRIKDYASYRGLLVMTGLENNAQGEHIVRSDDGKCALWVGAVDDLWKLGKPRGIGGPWKDSAVKANVPSDPYLMTGYDKKRVSLSHQSAAPIKVRLEVDLTGDGNWVTYQEFPVAPGQTAEHIFPQAFSAYWVRAVADKDTIASAIFTYE
ncbi:MAG TPA: hypothetical protein VGB77_17580 [Abditibacteriaceae bacterium]|jgi:hypothetical protein